MPGELIGCLISDEHAVRVLLAVASVDGVERALVKGAVGAHDDQRVALGAERHNHLKKNQATLVQGLSPNPGDAGVGARQGYG